mmetsp:Transcript_36121/g.41884  ORF Transcript_36121/g.41884 Transcript_36121/m.41884 type:complete len:136 (+) Transcript_36121:359-766(+)
MPYWYSTERVPEITVDARKGGGDESVNDLLCPRRLSRHPRPGYHASYFSSKTSKPNSKKEHRGCTQTPGECIHCLTRHSEEIGVGGLRNGKCNTNISDDFYTAKDCGVSSTQFGNIIIAQFQIRERVLYNTRCLK